MKFLGLKKNIRITDTGKVFKECKCGDTFLAEGYKQLFCSKECSYRFRKRPSGLKYNLKKKNPTWFEKNNIPWNWNSDSIGYRSLHKWIRKRLRKPDACQYCGAVESRLDLCNLSYSYKLDVKDWRYLCHPCHMDMDRNRGWGKGKKLYVRSYGE